MYGDWRMMSCVYSNLREDQGLVSVRHQFDNHLIKHLKLAADVHHVGAGVVEHAVLGNRILDKIGMVHTLPHVHHAALHAEVLLVALEPLHVECVGGRWTLGLGNRVSILLHLRQMLLKLVVILVLIIRVVKERSIVNGSLLPLLRKCLLLFLIFSHKISNSLLYHSSVEFHLSGGHWTVHHDLLFRRNLEIYIRFYSSKKERSEDLMKSR